MFQSTKSESGQISILVLVLSIVLLVATYLIGALAQVMVSQQRLNSKAESISLAGAQELEFNQLQACEVAQEFSIRNYGLNPDCNWTTENIEILLSIPNPNPVSAKILPKIYASSRAGIARDN